MKKRRRMIVVLVLLLDMSIAAIMVWTKRAEIERAAGQFIELITEDLTK